MAAPLEHEKPDAFTGGAHADGERPTRRPTPLHIDTQEPRHAQARCTALVAQKFVINRSHADGTPAFGAEVNSTQEKPLVFTYIDPTGEHREIWEQVRDFIEQIERQAAEELDRSG